MKKIVLCLSLLMLIGAGLNGSPASATVYDLFEMAFNVNGTISDSLNSDPLPPGLNAGGFNTVTGLGTITWTTSTPGPVSFFSFFDHEIDQNINGFTNETAFVHGNPPTYNPNGPWFWQAEEPGWTWGDLWNEFSGSSYENRIGMQSPNPVFDDVAMGIGRKFDLAAGEMAIITLTLGLTPPPGGWYLEQYDPASDASIYFSADYKVQGGVVPLPGTLLLLGSGLAALPLLRRKFLK